MRWNHNIFFSIFVLFFSAVYYQICAWCIVHNSCDKLAVLLGGGYKLNWKLYLKPCAYLIQQYNENCIADSRIKPAQWQSACIRNREKRYQNALNIQAFKLRALSLNSCLSIKCLVRIKNSRVVCVSYFLECLRIFWTPTCAKSTSLIICR